MFVVEDRQGCEGGCERRMKLRTAAMIAFHAFFICLFVVLLWETKKLFENPEYISWLIGYEPMPWYWVAGMFGVVILFVPWGCDGIPLIAWIVDDVVWRVRELKKIW